MLPWLINWNKRKPKTINGTVSSQTDYQMGLTIYKSSGTDTVTDTYLGGYCKDDFSDIRFTTDDGSTIIDHWIESYVLATSAIIWIKIPNIPATSTTTIYIYYDNPSATYDNSLGGGNTFIFFDNFTGTDGSNLNTSKWIAVKTGSAYAPDIFTNMARIRSTCSGCGSTPYIATTGPFGNQIITEFSFIIDTGVGQVGNQLRFMSSTTQGIYTTNGFLMSIAADRSVWELYNASGILSSYGQSFSNGNSFNMKIVRNGSVATVYRNGTQILNTTNYVNNTTDPHYISIGVWDGIKTIRVDNFRIRKYVSPEPTFNVAGPEELPIGYLEINSNPDHADVYIDDYLVTTTPDIIPLPVGIYNLRVHKNGYVDRTETIIITSGFTLYRTYDLPIIISGTGPLDIRTTPPGAQIYIDNVLQLDVNNQPLLTPVMITGIPIGPHNMKLTLVGYQDWIDIVPVEENVIIVVDIILLQLTIAAISIIATPSSPCIEGTCEININVTWRNNSTTETTFIPTLKIDNVPLIPEPPSEPLAGNTEVTKQFIITGLTKVGSPHTICPDPN